MGEVSPDATPGRIGAATIGCAGIIGCGGMTGGSCWRRRGAGCGGMTGGAGTGGGIAANTGCGGIIGWGGIIGGWCGCIIGRLKISGLICPGGVIMGVPPAVVSELSRVGGICLGTSNPRNFKLINLQAILNSIRVIFPSASVSARPLKSQTKINYLLSISGQGESDMAERGREEEPLIIFLTISGLGRAVATAIAGRSREPVPR